MQKGKGGLGLGGLGGQDLFQKITWVLGSIFMVGAMVLSLMKSTEHKKFRYLSPKNVIQQPLLPQDSTPADDFDQE
jgi:preprotein translocase subunit SecG